MAQPGKSASAASSAAHQTATSGQTGPHGQAGGQPQTAAALQAAKLLSKLGVPKKVIAALLKHVQLANKSSADRDSKKAKEIEKYTKAINDVMISASGTVSDLKSQIIDQVEEQNVFSHCLLAFPALPFESKKHIRHLLEAAFYQNSKNDTMMKKFAAHLGTEKIVDCIISQLAHSADERSVSNLSEMLKEFLKYEDTCILVVECHSLMRLTENFTSQTANISAQAFDFFKELMKSHFACANKWLREQHDKLQQIFNQLLVMKSSEAFMYHLLVTNLYHKVIKDNSMYREMFTADVENLRMMLRLLMEAKSKNLRCECMMIVTYFFEVPSVQFIIISNVNQLDAIIQENLSENDSKAAQAALKALFSSYLLAHQDDPNLVNILKQYRLAIEANMHYHSRFLKNLDHLKLLLGTLKQQHAASHSAPEVDPKQQQQCSSDLELCRECLRLLKHFYTSPNATQMLTERSATLKGYIAMYMDPSAGGEGQELAAINDKLAASRR